MHSDQIDGIRNFIQDHAGFCAASENEISGRIKRKTSYWCRAHEGRKQGLQCLLITDLSFFVLAQLVERCAHIVPDLFS